MKRSKKNVYIASAKHCWIIKLGEFKSDFWSLCQINQEIWKPQKKKKKIKSQQFKNFSTNVPTVGEDLLRAFYRLFSLQFCDSSDQWKKKLAKVLLLIWEIFLHENNRNCNFYRFTYKFTFVLFLPFLTNQKTRIRFLASWWFGNKKYFCFLFIASHALLQSYAEFNRLL